MVTLVQKPEAENGPPITTLDRLPFSLVGKTFSACVEFRRLNGMLKLEFFGLRIKQGEELLLELELKDPEMLEGDPAELPLAELLSIGTDPAKQIRFAEFETINLPEGGFFQLICNSHVLCNENGVPRLLLGNVKIVRESNGFNSFTELDGPFHVPLAVLIAP